MRRKNTTIISSQCKSPNPNIFCNGQGHQTLDKHQHQIVLKCFLISIMFSIWLGKTKIYKNLTPITLVLFFFASWDLESDNEV
jgi:hypothetical protein